MLTKSSLSRTALSKNKLSKDLIYEVVSAPFFPSDISGLILWLDADDLSTITQSSGSVSRWDDKSGVGNYLVQGTSSRQPIVSTYNGKKSIFFTDNSGTQNQYLYGENRYITSNNDGMTIFAIYRSDDASDQPYLLDQGVVGNKGLGIIISTNNNVGVYTSVDYGGEYRGDIAFTQDLNPIAVSFVIEFGVNQRVWKNGSLKHTGAITLSKLDSTTMALSPITTPFTSGPFTIGASSKDSNGTGTFNRGFTGDLFEMVIYNKALTDQERQQVESYLLSKWGIT